MSEEPELIYVKAEEYKQEEELITRLEGELSRLEARWQAFVNLNPERLLVSLEEYNREWETVRVLQRQIKDEWSRAMHYLSVYRWARVRERLAIIRVIPALSRTQLTLYREARKTITQLQRVLESEREEIRRKTVIPQNMISVLAQIRTVRYNLQTETERFSRKIILEEFIGPEEITGFHIYYTEELEYPVIHPLTTQLIRTEKELVIEATASIETKTGQDVPIVLEVTAITTITEMGKADINSITRRDGPIETAVRTWLREENWGELADVTAVFGYGFLGKTIEKRRMYPVEAPDYPRIAVWVERRSRYIEERRYPSTGAAEITA